MIAQHGLRPIEDGLLMIVTDEMDAWKRLESQGVAQSLTSVHRDHRALT